MGDSGTLQSRIADRFSVAFFTQLHCIISGALVHPFSADGDSHRAKHFCCKDEQLCNSHRKPAPWLLKRCDGPHHDDDVGVFLRCFPGVPPVNLNTQIVHNHMDAVIMCSD